MQGKELLLLLAMADFSNDQGFFFASQTTLAKKARCSTEYVRKVTQKWVESGALKVVRKGHSVGFATEYQITPLALSLVDNSEDNSPTQLGGSYPHPQPSWGELPNSSGKLPNSIEQQLSLQRNKTNGEKKSYPQEVKTCEIHAYQNLPCRGCAADRKAAPQLKAVM